MSKRTFDRRVQYDERSRAYPIRTLVEALPLRSYTWSCPVRLDQGNLGSCVGNAWAQELAARPKRHARVSEETALTVYRDAQSLDEWPETPPEEGTSVLAGAKAMVQRGYLKEYRWAFTLSDLALAVGHKGPAVLGVNWWTGMLEADAYGYIHPGGWIEGGHAILCNGFSIKKGFRLTNSWGSAWGENGCCWVSASDMESLLSDEGEACIPTQRTIVPELK